MTDVAARPESRYMFDQAWQEERARLAALEQIWDTNTLAHLEALGQLDGWRCLEVGGGGGSVAAWLCERAGPGGHVVATDLNTRFLEAIELPNLEVRAHDVTRETFEPGAYDLVHTRLLLSHLPAHREALGNMTAALKPGGVLVVEEFDHVSFLPDPESPEADRAVWMRFLQAFDLLSAKRGLDLAYGRRLTSLLRGSGLVDVRAEGRSFMERGGVEGRGLLLLSVKSLRPSLVKTGAIDEGGVDQILALLEEPAFSWMSQMMVTAFGRKL